MTTPIKLEIPEGINENIQIPKHQFRKMIFLLNALEEGWTVKKLNDNYIFTKKHENRKEIFQENYLETFLVSNLSIDAFNKIK
jgi:hypothetical protein